MRVVAAQLLAFTVLSFCALPAGLTQGRVGSQGDAERLVQRADERLRAGRPQEAAQLYRLAIDRHQLESAYERYSMLLFAQRRFLRGLAVSEAGLLQHRTSVALRAQRGAHRFKLGRQEKAYQDLQPIASTRPRDFALQALTAQCCMEADDYRCALQSIERYLKARPKLLSPKDQPFRIMRAKALLRLGRLKRADREIRLLLSMAPKHLPCQALLAELLVAKKTYVAAESRLAGLVGRLTDPYLHLLRGQALLQMARRQLPNTDLAALLRRPVSSPETPADATSSRAMPRQKTPEGMGPHGGTAGGATTRPADDGVKALARRALLAAGIYLKARPQGRAGLILRADALHLLGRHDHSLRVLKGAGDGIAIRWRRARALLAQNAPREALIAIGTISPGPKLSQTALRIALQAAIAAKDPSRRRLAALAIPAKAEVATLLWASQAYQSVGEHARAASLLARIDELHPKRAAVRFLRGRLYLSNARRAVARGEEGVALAALNQASNVIPSSLFARRNLAWLHLKAGRHHAAEQAITPLLDQVPGDYEINRLAGRIFAAKGLWSRAEEAFLKAAQVAKAQGAASPWLTARAVALGEAGVAAAHQKGSLDRAVAALRQGAALAHKTPVGAAGLPSNARPRAASAWRLRLLRALAQVLLRRAAAAPQRARSAQDLKEARPLIAGLADPDREALGAMVTVISLFTKHPPRWARRALRRQRREVAQAFRLPLLTVGPRLLEAYAATRVGSLPARARALRRLAALARRLPPTTREDVMHVAARIGYRLADAHFKKKQLLAARRLFDRAMGYDPGVRSPATRHNRAVIYFKARPAQSRRTLQSLREVAPLSLCNLAVYNWHQGKPRKAFALFTACLDAKGAYPGVNRWVMDHLRVKEALK